MKKNRIDWLSIILLAGTAIFTILIYPKLPSSLPSSIHFDGNYVSRSTNLELTWRFFLLILMTFIAQIPHKLIKVDYENPKRKTISFSTRLIIIMLITYHIVSIGIALGYNLNTKLYSVILVSLFMILIGNKMPQLKFNRYVGFRLPWTIRDEETWRVTHRLLGYLSIPLALLQFILSFFINLNWAVFCGFGIWFITGTIYSLIFYMKKYSIYPLRKN